MHMTEPCQTMIDEASCTSKKILEAYQDLETRINEVHHQLSDIQKTRAHELQEKKQLTHKLGVLFEILPVGIIVLNNQGIIEQANSEAESIFEKKLLHQSWSQVIQQVFSPKIDDGLEVSLINGKRISVKTSTLEQDQSQLIVLHDLTETRKLLDEVNHQRRLADLGSMMASLAHQIRTPLATAILYLGHIGNKHVTFNQLQTYGERSLERLKVVNCMIEDMLLFVKGQNRPRERILVETFFFELEKMLNEDLEDKNVSLRVAINCGDEILEINKQALMGAIQNCVINSIEAAESAKMEMINVNIYCQKNKDNQIEISIEDNGPGIDQKDLDKIFKAFYTNKPRGTGLGLAVVKSVLDAHQGKIFIHSQAKKGTAVVLQLPLCHCSEVCNA